MCILCAWGNHRRLKFRIMKIRVQDAYTPKIWITAFELQRRWKIDGVRFSADHE